MNKKNRPLTLKILEIETTNRCNLDCPHCMMYEVGESGTDYNDFMEYKIIDQFFSNMDVALIHTLNFTGGEPLLNVDIILYTLKKIMREKIKVLGIDIATNGTVLNAELIDQLNKFAEYVKKEVLGEVIIKDENTLKTKNIEQSKLINLRISNSYHNNDPEKALDFYTSRANDSIKVIIINDKESHKVEWDNDDRISIAYSGRAKKLDAEFYCDSPRHKIEFENWDETTSITCVRCPLRLMTNGDISIASCSPFQELHANAIGNVNDGITLQQMITDWNYRTPLTCKEACECEEVKMYHSRKPIKDISRVLKKNMILEDLDKMIEHIESKYFHLENCRHLIHKKMPVLTADEVEKVSMMWFDLESKKENQQLSEKEIEDEKEKLDNYVSKLVYEHSFDDVLDTHQKYPYLTHDECMAMETLSNMTQGLLGSLMAPACTARINMLIETNEYRSKNVESIF